MIAVEHVFDDWNREVLWSLRRRFRGTAEATLEDGAAFAWAQFAAKPPPDDYALAWLKLVARREVLALIRRWERPVQMRADAASYDKPGEDHRSTCALESANTPGWNASHVASQQIRWDGTRDLDSIRFRPSGSRAAFCPR